MCANMATMNGILLLSIVCFFGCQAYTPAEIYGSLSDQDKGLFLRYYLVKGYYDSRILEPAIYPRTGGFDDLPIPQDLVQTFSNIEIEPDNFAESFFHGFMRKYNLSSVEALQVARRRCNCIPRDKYLCMPNGECVDVGDVGSICCT